MTKSNDESGLETPPRAREDAQVAAHPPEEPDSRFEGTFFDTATQASLLIALAAQTAFAWPLLRWQHVG
ncbi:MAG TPA: hypothetical protein EYP14_12785, partial [Planctomycetaceae bacterium]|nr:hypothetical protein [Planctomycetaceae bacterium]